VKRAREQIKHMTEDLNPYLAAKAKEFLKRTEEAAAK